VRHAHNLPLAAHLSRRACASRSSCSRYVPVSKIAASPCTPPHSRPLSCSEPCLMPSRIPSMCSPESCPRLRRSCHRAGSYASPSPSCLVLLRNIFSCIVTEVSIPVTIYAWSTPCVKPFDPIAQAPPRHPHCMRVRAARLARALVVGALFTRCQRVSHAQSLRTSVCCLTLSRALLNMFRHIRFTLIS
jgi:hypothetical protein